MVLVGEGRAEQRHQAVAEELVHGSLVAVDLRQHQLKGVIHDLMDVLGIEVLGQGGERRDIDEEDGDLLALALKGRPRRKDLFGEVPGGVRLGRSEPRLSGCRPGYRMCALGTELPGSRELHAAVRARCPNKRCATFRAELRPWQVLLFAPRTPHCRASVT
jgi:hypothetical protein